MDFSRGDSAGDGKAYHEFSTAPVNGGLPIEISGKCRRADATLTCSILSTIPDCFVASSPIWSPAVLSVGVGNEAGLPWPDPGGLVA